MTKLRGADLTPAELKVMFENHLTYEINMFRGLYAQLHSTPSADPYICNAVIEAYLLHARNLIEFFKNKKPCDVDPRHFTSAGYEPNGNFINHTLEALINQQITHFTSDRKAADGEKIDGPKQQLINGAIEQQIERFERSLTSAYPAKWNPTQTLTMASGAGGASNAIQQIGSNVTGPASPRPTLIITKNN